MSTQAARQQPVGLAGGGPPASREAPLVADRFMLHAVVVYPHTELVLTNRQLDAGPTERLVSVQRGLG